jgi:hypothetical protein
VGAPDHPVEARDPYRRAARRGSVVPLLLAAREDWVAPAGPEMPLDRAAADRADKEVPPEQEAAAPVATPVV